MNKDQEAADWATEILTQTIQRRESRTQAVAPYFYPFTMGKDGVEQLPTVPISAGHPPSLPLVEKILSKMDPLYAYLYLMPGEPTPPSVWQGPTFTDQDRAQLPLGIPREIIEDGEFDFYVFGVFVSNSVSRTFCVPVSGDKFGKLRILSGTYGGIFSEVSGVGASA